MKEWITAFIEEVESKPQNFNKDIKNNVRQIKELITRENIVYKQADPVSFDKFCSLHKHREGKWAGQPILLDKIERYIVACILGLKEQREGKWVRYFQELDFFISRKYGKDHFIAPLIEWFTAFDREPNAWCQILAENEKQSKRTYDIIKGEIANEPLNEIFVERKTEKYIKSTINNGKIEYLSGRSKGKDGSNPSVGVCNEVHEVTNFNQYNAIKSGMGAREQPMMIVISSAGITPASLYESLLERNRKFLSKKKLTKSDRIFALMFGIDDTDDCNDPSCWIKANPMMEEGRPTMKFLKEQYEAMKDDPVMFNTFIAKHLNRQVGASIDYFDMMDIKKSMTKIKTDDIYDSYAVGGLDLSETTDLTNATLLILKENKFITIQAYFIAEECLERNSARDKMAYAQFQNCNSDCEAVRKLVYVTPGGYVDQRVVWDWFIFMANEYQINILKIGFDRWMSKEFVHMGAQFGFVEEKTERIDDNVETRDYGVLTMVAQGSYTLSGAIKIIRTLWRDDKIVYDQTNKLLPYCFYNLKVKVDTNNNVSPHKAKSTGHIDGAIGVFNAFVAYQRAKPLYESRLPQYFKI